MKKPNKTKKEPPKKAKDSDDLRKPAKLKPLKEKDKKGWKLKRDDEEDDFEIEDDMKFDTNFDDDDEDDHYHDDY